MTARDRKSGSLAFLLQKITEAIDYRTPRTVTELVIYQNPFRETGYYICPRCDCTLDREFVSFCDRCGQKLDWRMYTHAKIRRRPTGGCIETPRQSTLL